MKVQSREDIKEHTEKYYYESWLTRINFLEKLAGTTLDGIALDQEALTLCLCYIDGLANVFYKGNGSRNNFIQSLIKFGGDPIFGAVHPEIFTIYLEKNRNKRNKNKKLDNLYGILEPYLKELLNEKFFFTQEELYELIEKNLTINPEHIKLLKDSLLNGSYAAMAYEELRCGAIHGLGARTWSFDGMFFNNKPVERLSFDFLYIALKNMISDELIIKAVKASCWRVSH